MTRNRRFNPELVAVLIAVTPAFAVLLVGAVLSRQGDSPIGLGILFFILLPAGFLAVRPIERYLRGRGTQDDRRRVN